MNSSNKLLTGRKRWPKNYVRLQNPPPHPHQPQLHGGSLLYRLKGFLFGATEMTREVRTVLERHGAERIVAMRVCREPVTSAIQKIVNILSLGRTPYDKLFHLSLYITTDAGTQIKTEKHQIVRARIVGNVNLNTECEDVPMSSNPTLIELFAKAYDRDGVNLWRYNAFSYNCQRYVSSLLIGSNLMTPELNQFINQDAAAILRSLPPGTSRVFQGLTDLAGKVSTVLGGMVERERSRAITKAGTINKNWLKTKIRGGQLTPADVETYLATHQVSPLEAAARRRQFSATPMDQKALRNAQRNYQVEQAMWNEAHPPERVDQGLNAGNKPGKVFTGDNLQRAAVGILQSATRGVPIPGFSYLTDKLIEKFGWQGYSKEQLQYLDRVLSLGAVV